jgi:hypothetical protein
MVGANISKAQALYVYDVYEVFEDGTEGERFLFCEFSRTIQDVTVNSVPWHFYLQVEILRAGETEREIITSALDPNQNLTKYSTYPIDGVVPSKNLVDLDVPNTDPVETRTFHFENARLLSAADEAVMAATSNPISDNWPDEDNPDVPDPLGEPTPYGEVGYGLCSNAYPGPAVIGGIPQPLTITLAKGDTLIVQARRADAAPTGTGYYLPDSVVIKGDLTLDNQAVAVIGSNVSSDDPGAGFSFSFTSQ